MTRPRLSSEIDLLSGLAAVALFAVLALSFVSIDSGFWQPGFGADASVMRSIGAAMFNIDPAAVTSGGAGVASEGFLVVFEIVDLVIVAALVGAIMLARREPTEPAIADGGEDS